MEKEKDISGADPNMVFPELSGMNRLQRVEFLARKLLVVLSRGGDK